MKDILSTQFKTQPVFLIEICSILRKCSFGIINPSKNQLF